LAINFFKKKGFLKLKNFEIYNAKDLVENYQRATLVRFEFGKLLMIDNSPEKHTRLSVQKRKLEREKMLSEINTKETSEQKSQNDSMFGFQDKED
jgi:hypothetical protein